MRKHFTIMALVAVAFFLVSAGAYALSWNEQVSAFSSYYGIDSTTIAMYYSTLGGWNNVDRALYISSRTGASPNLIAQDYFDGESFTQIADKYQMNKGTYTTPVVAAALVVDFDMAARLSQLYGLDASVITGYYTTLKSWGDVERALYIAKHTGVSADIIVQRRVNYEPFSMIAVEEGMTKGMYFTPITDLPLSVG